MTDLRHQRHLLSIGEHIAEACSAISDGGSCCWHVLEGFSLHWRTWDEETVVYQEGSGETHLLGPIEVAVLQRIEHNPATRDQLATHLINLLEATPGTALLDYLDNLLDRFYRLALIEPLSQREGS